MLTEPPEDTYDGIVMAVAHDIFRSGGAGGIRRYGRAEHVLFDLKYVFSPEEVDIRL
jgi:UDP-N-acetyl-D-galactosamine dehydrogenase